MTKNILMTIFILSALTMITFVPITFYLLNNVNEDMVDIIYLDILSVIWSLGIIVSMTLKIRKERKK